MKKIVIKDMLIKVRRESDNSEGWIRMTELVQTIVESILEETKKETLTKHNNDFKYGLTRWKFEEPNLAKKDI